VARPPSRLSTAPVGYTGRRDNRTRRDALDVVDTRRGTRGEPPHRSRPRGLFALLAVYLISSMTAFAGGRPADAATGTLARWSPGRPGTMLLHLDGGPLDVATEARRRRVIVFNAWESSYIAQVKAVNPNIIALVYKDLSSTRSYACSRGVDNAELPTGVGYCDANANHPAWFLHDRRGRRMEWNGYQGHWMMDVGNHDYWQAWLEGVRRDVVARGWDGVWIDNALTERGAYGMDPAQYPDDASMQSATRSMLAVVGPSLRAASLFTVANIDARRFPNLWADWIGLLSGGFDEHFVDWSDTPNSSYEWDWGADGWRAQVAEITSASAAGRTAVVRSVTVGSDVEGLRYSLASYLLANDGRQIFGDLFDVASWYPEYDYDLGEPSGSFYALGNGVYRRNFTAGSVVVNASRATTQTIRLGGVFVDGTGRRVDAVTLNGTRAAILRRPR
jgi:hypothetical protein